MASRIVSVPIDCTDAELLASFWAAVLGWRIAERGWQQTGHGPDGVSIAPIGGGPFEIDFRWVPGGPSQSKNRLHLDINPTDRDQDSELNRLLALGAKPVDVGQGQVSWHVLADPEGNVFCLCRDQVEP
ncbi:MAG: VOC family protein [Geodermatophilaceae bacterium]|jgi:predicted enzyme related to lactoylglutathione lyase